MIAEIERQNSTAEDDLAKARDSVELAKGKELLDMFDDHKVSVIYELLARGSGFKISRHSET